MVARTTLEFLTLDRDQNSKREGLQFFNFYISSQSLVRYKMFIQLCGIFKIRRASSCLDLREFNFIVFDFFCNFRSHREIIEQKNLFSPPLLNRLVFRICIFRFWYLKIFYFIQF